MRNVDLLSHSFVVETATGLIERFGDMVNRPRDKFREGGYDAVPLFDRVNHGNWHFEIGYQDVSRFPAALLPAGAQN